MLDQFTHLFRFQAIAEEGSLRKASERLKLTQPALSRSLALLEASFGRELLERHARGVRPTPFGERVLNTSRRMIRHWELAELELQSGDGDTRASLKIGVGPIWRSGILAPVFMEMKQRHPKVLLEVIALREGQELADLDEGRLDVVLGGVRIDSRQHPHLKYHWLTDLIVQIAAREGHPAFERLRPDDPKSEQCLLDYPWIVYNEMALYDDRSHYWISDRLGRDPDIWLKSGNLLTVLTMLQRSDSLCVLSDLAIGAVAQPRVLPLPVELRRRRIPLGLVHREELADWVFITDFLDMCRRRFENQTLPA